MHIVWLWRMNFQPRHPSRRHHLPSVLKSLRILREVWETWTGSEVCHRKLEMFTEKWDFQGICDSLWWVSWWIVTDLTRPPGLKRYLLGRPTLYGWSDQVTIVGSVLWFSRIVTEGMREQEVKQIEGWTSKHCCSVQQWYIYPMFVWKAF